MVCDSAALPPRLVQHRFRHLLYGSQRLHCQRVVRTVHSARLVGGQGRPAQRVWILLRRGGETDMDSLDPSHRAQPAIVPLLFRHREMAHQPLGLVHCLTRCRCHCSAHATITLPRCSTPMTPAGSMIVMSPRQLTSSGCLSLAAALCSATERATRPSALSRAPAATSAVRPLRSPASTG